MSRFVTGGESVDHHAGRPAIVMGGAPCLPDDLSRVDLPGALRISANEHGARLGPVDWCVFGDRTHQITREPMVERIRRHHAGPMVTQQFLAEPEPGVVRLHNWAQWGVPANSGHMAVLWAWLLGCRPIVVCGIEHYSGGTYHHDPRAKSAGHYKKAGHYDGIFKTLFFRLQPCMVRAVSGPLAKIVGTYDPKEPVPRLPVPGRWQAYWAQEFGLYRVLQTHALTRVGPQQFKAGDVVRLSGWEAREGLKYEWLVKENDNGAV